MPLGIGDAQPKGSHCNGVCEQLQACMQPNMPFEAEHADRESTEREQDHKRDRHEDSMGVDTADGEVLNQCFDVLEGVGVQHLGCFDG